MIALAMDTAPSADIGPGIAAFFAFFFLAVALWLLMRSMNGQLRRMSYRAKDRSDQDASSSGDEPTQAGTDR